jgi:hypothetical protein
LNTSICSFQYFLDSDDIIIDDDNFYSSTGQDSAKYGIYLPTSLKKNIDRSIEYSFKQ